MLVDFVFKANNKAHFLQRGSSWDKTKNPTVKACDGQFDRSRPEALSVFAGRNERLDHLGTHEITIELIQLCQPEVVAGVVGVRAGVWIAAEVTEELH